MRSHGACTRAAPPTIVLRVLVADHGVSVNDGLTAMLSDFEGLSVFGCAQSPTKVLALVRAVHPDVVILDLSAEIPSGLETLREIKREPAAPCVIVLSHFDLTPVRRAALTAGADYFLLKARECGRLPEVLTRGRRQLLLRRSRGGREALPPLEPFAGGAEKGHA